MNLLPGIGIEDITFGMTPEDVHRLLGNPDKSITDSDYEERYIVEYNKYYLRLIFYKDEGHKLGYIHTKHPNTVYKNHTIIGKTINEVQNTVFAELGIIWEKDTYDFWNCYYNDNFWITLNEEFGRIKEVEIGVNIDEEDNFVWIENFKDS